MAYGDNTLNADHRWSLNNTLSDSIGTMTLTNSGGTFVTTPISRDATHSYQTNGRDDILSVLPTSNTGTSALSQYAFGGWFQVSQIQGPPVLIHKQGGTTHGYALFLWAGNNVMLQVIKDTRTTIFTQLYSNISLIPNRPYHFLVTFSGSGFDNEINFYLDGIKQLENTGGLQPNQTTMGAYTGSLAWGENGTASIDVPVGAELVLVKAPVNGFWSEWWTWSGGNAALSEDDINNVIFGEGALPSIVITSGTEVAMQAQIDLIANTVRSDSPLAILIEPVTGNGDLTLISNNITFEPRVSLHVRYEGAGKLTWINQNGSNANRGSTSGQKIDFVQAVNTKITALDASTLSPIVGARVYIKEVVSGTVIANNLTDGNGEYNFSYTYSEDVAVTGVVRKGSSTIYYKGSIISDIITADGLDLNVLMIRDE